MFQPPFSVQFWLDPWLKCTLEREYTIDSHSVQSLNYFQCFSFFGINSDESEIIEMLHVCHITLDDFVLKTFLVAISFTDTQNQKPIRKKIFLWNHSEIRTSQLYCKSSSRSCYSLWLIILIGCFNYSNFYLWTINRI